MTSYSPTAPALMSKPTEEVCPESLEGELSSLAFIVASWFVDEAFATAVAPLSQFFKAKTAATTSRTQMAATLMTIPIFFCFDRFFFSFASDLGAMYTGGTEAFFSRVGCGGFSTILLVDSSCGVIVDAVTVLISCSLFG